MNPLRWESGARSAAEGKDLAAVCRTLSSEELSFWRERCRGMVHEVAIIEAELARRQQPRQQLTLFDLTQR